MLRKINRIEHSYFPLQNGVQPLPSIKNRSHSKSNAAYFSEEILAILRPAVPKPSAFRAQRIIERERRTLITKRLWEQYG